jgi:hypothetical protein
VSFLIPGAAAELIGTLGNAQHSQAATGSAQTTALSNAATAAQGTSTFANLNLTATEQSQIASILKTAQSQHLSFAQLQSKISSVLTPAQQQTLQTDLQGLKGSIGGHHHHHGHGGSSKGGSSSSIVSNTDAFGVPSTNTGSSTTTAPSSLFSDLASQLAFQPQGAAEL